MADLRELNTENGRSRMLYDDETGIPNAPSVVLRIEIYFQIWQVAEFAHAVTGSLEPYFRHLVSGSMLSAEPFCRKLVTESHKPIVVVT